MRKILAIDDQLDNLTTIKAVIKMLMPNIQVLTAQSGEQGIQMAKENNPDVILLDIIMPKMDGYEVCKMLKQDESTKHISVAMITALQTDSESKVKALEIGAEAFIAKPIEPIELIAQLKVLLRTKEAEDKLREERDNLNETVKQRTKELEENEHKYRSLVESSQEPILVIQNGIIQFANPVTSHLSGFKYEEMHGSSFLQFIHKNDQEKILNNYKKRAAGEKVNNNIDFRIVTKKGDDWWFNFKVNNIEWKGEKALLYILNDITEKREIEKQKRINSERDKVLLELYNKALSASDKEIIDFVLDKAVKITESQIGFFHKFNEDLNTIHLTAWNHQALKNCDAAYETHYPMDKAGNWVDCVREKKIIVYNDFPNSPNQKGLPKGHAALHRYMSVPVFLNGKIFYIFGIGNKQEDYNETDKQNLQIIANELSKILEKRGYEEEVKESTEKYLAIHNNAPLPFQSLNEEGNILEVNPAWLKTMGYQKEEVLGRWYGDFLHESYVPIFIKNFPKLKNKGEVRNVPFKLKRKNGEYIDIKLDGTSGYTAEGEFRQTYCTFKNVTEELIQLHKLEESEAKYRSFAEHFDGIAFRGFNNYSVDFMNGKVKSITGYQEQDFVNGRIKFLDLIHPDDKKQVNDDVMEFMNSDLISKHLEYRFVSKNKEVKWISETITKFEEKKKSGVYGIIQDISKIKEANILLEESNTFNQSLIDTLPFPMEIVDENGNILFMNPVFEKLVGKQNIRNKCWHTYKDDKTQCKDCPLKNSLTIGQIEKTESTGVLGGKTFEIVHCAMLFEGKKALMEIFIDTTERNEYEKNLIEAKNKALESDNLKSAFLANMSHEIRTPMNGILGFLDLLSDKHLSQEEQDNYISVVNRSGARLLDTINDIIEISKIQSGLSTVHKKTIDVLELLRHLNNFFAPQAKEKGIILSIDFDDNQELITITDHIKLESILTNLIKNAIKFTDKGYVQISFKILNDKLEFCIKDSGIGVPDNKIDRIFNYFEQANLNLNSGHEGSGLGLSIAKSYCKQLGGEIWVKSKLGEGSQFYFTIDYAPHENKDKKNFEKKPNKNELSQLNGINLLIAEDDKGSFSLIEAILRNEGCSIIRANNGEEAVSLIKEKPAHFSLILMDLKMPVMGGIEATKIIRETKIKIPIIAQTAYALSDDKQKALEAGCDDYISKPIIKKNLIRLITKYL